MYERPSSSAANPDSDGESEVRPHKKTLKCWTPVITNGFRQLVEPRHVCFVNTERLHRAMGTSDEDRRLLNQPARQGAGFVFKLEKWDLNDPSVAEDLISVYGLPSDKELAAATRAWLQSANCADHDPSLNVQVASSHLNLRTVVPSAEDDPSFALLLPGRRKVKAQKKEALAQ